MAAEKCITIIGGGFSGTLTAVQLLRQSPFPIHVRIINAGYPVAKGVAYSAESNLHLLNVRAGRMSAFPQQPLHFVRWLEKQPGSEEFCTGDESLVKAFIPRRIYGQYLEDLLEHTRENLPAGCSLEIINDEATAVVPAENNTYHIKLKNGGAFLTRKLVLALGNFVPGAVAGVSEAVMGSQFYMGNPWQSSGLDALDPEKPVLLIGTGLTMVDVVLSLLEQQFRGKIYAVSSKGYLPMVHPQSNPYPDISQELQPPFQLTSLYATIKKHIRKAEAMGSSCEAFIDSIRPLTQQIWQGLSLPDKEKFIRHLSSLWGVFRHRISPQIGGRIQAALDSGQFEVVAGRLQSTEIKADQLEVTVKERGTGKPAKFLVQRLVNCTGPQCNYPKIESELVKNLLETRLITSDELRLGIKAEPDGRVLQENDKPSGAVFTIGPALRGALWESTAVPEISEQAAHLAQTILQSFFPVINTEITCK
jgi:uncharacterized NAD(P)/FAD-binding protein YdhS